VIQRSTLDSPFSVSRRAETFNGGSNQPPYYVIVFGYPQDKYSITVDYFKSLGNTTEPDLSPELVNCFKIGYYDAGDAMRVLRKSGEILYGCFMIGVKQSVSTGNLFFQRCNGIFTFRHLGTSASRNASQPNVRTESWFVLSCRQLYTNTSRRSDDSRRTLFELFKRTFLLEYTLRRHTHTACAFDVCFPAIYYWELASG